MRSITVKHSVTWITPNDHPKCDFLLALTKDAGNKSWPRAAGRSRCPPPRSFVARPPSEIWVMVQAVAPCWRELRCPCDLPEFWEGYVPKSQAPQPRCLSSSVSYEGSSICISLFRIGTSSGLQKASNRAFSSDSQTVEFNGSIKFQKQNKAKPEDLYQVANL